jgi:hypothetical protein
MELFIHQLNAGVHHFFDQCFVCCYIFHGVKLGVNFSFCGLLKEIGFDVEEIAFVKDKGYLVFDPGVEGGQVFYIF